MTFELILWGKRGKFFALLYAGQDERLTYESGSQDQDGEKPA